ncbi:MAG TPA: AI-2E family transporter, partial [Rhodanobacter sp.]|nr:AI-2E family transporter [Rhodanobacter sp.]
MSEIDPLPPAPAMLPEPSAEPDITPDAELPPEVPLRRAAPGTRYVRGMRRHLRALRVVMNALLLLALLYTITITRALLIPL